MICKLPTRLNNDIIKSI